MFGRRKDIQIPKTPNTGDKATQNWMTAIGAMLNKYIGGGSDDRLVSARELLDGGIAGVGTGGFLTTPPQNLTKPPKVTGLQANGALASIFVSWVNPSFSNYAYTELWRSNDDDIGQAVLIASTAVESYTDNVGSAATKYYWARAVSDQGVKGDFNAANGTKGTTSLDPDYVMQVLTSSTWKPNTTYYPFQYVRPTVDNGFQYAAVDGGKSGNIEPTWPLSVDPTVITNDGTVQWKCLHIEDRIPFVLGTLEDGTPAVFMDTAYIKNATITSAKISNLIADKITTGDLNADLHVLQKLWYGFSEFANLSSQTGFWLGVESGVPKFKIDTGAANGNKSLTYDGYDLKLTGDGLFDDIFVDSASFNTISTNTISFNQQVVPSKYIAEQGMTLNHPDYQGYLCAVEQINKTVTVTGASFIDEDTTPSISIQCANSLIKPYNQKDNSTYLRFKDKNIVVKGSISGFFLGSSYSIFVLYISGQHVNPTDYSFFLTSAQLGSISSGAIVTLTKYHNGKPLTVNFFKSSSSPSTSTIIFYFTDTYGALDYYYPFSEIFAFLFVLYNPLYGGASVISPAWYNPSLSVQAIKPAYQHDSLISSDPLIT